MQLVICPYRAEMLFYNTSSFFSKRPPSVLNNQWSNQRIDDALSLILLPWDRSFESNLISVVIDVLLVF